MPKAPIDVSYDYSGALLNEKRLSAADVAGAAAAAKAAHAHVLKDADAFARTGPKVGAAATADAWDPGYIDWPARLLDEYAQKREASELGRILKAAHRLRELIDRVVILGIGGSYMGAKAMFDALCDPYFNELSRGDRGSRPRVYFEGNNVDNDSAQALLRILGGRHQATKLDERWGIVVISKSGGTLETAVSFRIFTRALKKSVGDAEGLLQRLIVPVTGEGSKLHKLTQALGVTERLDVPDGIGGRFSVLTAVGLLPAALLGIDIVKLLQGARKFTEYFKANADLSSNIVLQMATVGHLLEKKGVTTRVLSLWGKRLESFGLWYDQLLAESLGKERQGATPITSVNTRDLHSRQQQHQQGRQDKLFTNLVIEQPSDDILTVGHADADDDDLNRYTARTLPEILQIAVQATDEALHSDGQPTATIAIPRLDEETLGELFQMQMLATSVEGAIMGINPYGQPGVEIYKRNMQRLLAE
jgi:glucose-6-phosphate isomerase